MKTKLLFPAIILTSIALVPAVTIAQQNSTQALRATTNVLNDNTSAHTFCKGKSIHAGKNLNAYAKANMVKAQTLVNDYYKGLEDADSSYSGKKSGKGLVFFSTLIGTPVVGVVSTVICSVTKPTKQDLGITNTALLNDNAYMKGYGYEARYIKKRKAWKNYIMASLIWASALQILIL